MACLCRYLLIIFVTLEHFSVKAIFCTVPVYGTQKKVATAGIEPLSGKCLLRIEMLTNCQLVHHASADILKNISTVPLSSSSSFVIFIYLLLLPAVFTIIFIIHQHGCNPSKASIIKCLTRRHVFIPA